MRTSACLLSLLLSFLPAAVAQGTPEDYARANRFLPWNARKLVLDADITPQHRALAVERTVIGIFAHDGVDDDLIGN